MKMMMMSIWVTTINAVSNNKLKTIMKKINYTKIIRTFTKQWINKNRFNINGKTKNRNKYNNRNKKY